MRRSQQRRSSNTMPFRPGLGIPNSVKTSQLMMSQPRDVRKRASSIPRPSVTPSFTRQRYGRTHDQNISTAVTPSRSHSAQRPTTPQKNSMTPQKHPPLIKPFPKEMRNFNDKNYVKDMMCNIVNFLVEFGYPDQMISIKDMQKIDKQSFINYFNFICQFLDRNFQLAARFNEEELMKYVKICGYGGTLTKSALVSIGALHSTSQIIGLSSWMAESARILMWESTDEEEECRTMTLERQEMNITITAYNAWISEEPCNYEEELIGFYKSFFQVEDGAVEKIESQIAVVVGEYKLLEQKGSQMEDLKIELKKQEHLVDDLIKKKEELHGFLSESAKEEAFNSQRLEELKQKTVDCQREIAELKIAAKSCKLSAAEARQMKAECTKLRSEKQAIMEQRAEVAELFEKREVQLANISAQGLKISRKFNVDLMDMGLIVGEDADWQGKLATFLKEKTEIIPKMEAKTLAVTEDKERMSNKKSHLVMELKHTEMQKRRLDDALQANKLEREELKQIFLDEKTSLESAVAAVSARSDPAEKRLQLELDSIMKRIQETDAETQKTEKDIQQRIQERNMEFEKYSKELEDERNKADEYYIKLFATFKESMRAAVEGRLSSVDLKYQPILPKHSF